MNALDLIAVLEADAQPLEKKAAALRLAIETLRDVHGLRQTVHAPVEIDLETGLCEAKQISITAPIGVQVTPAERRKWTAPPSQTLNPALASTLRAEGDQRARRGDGLELVMRYALLHLEDHETVTRRDLEELIPGASDYHPNFVAKCLRILAEQGRLVLITEGKARTPAVFGKVAAAA